MEKKQQKYLTIGVTVLAAAATAHLMQRNSGAEAAKFRSAAEATASASAEIAPAATRNATVLGPFPARVTQVAATSTATETPVPATIKPETHTFAAAPAMPRPPEAALRPAQLPGTGAELQDRMAKLGRTPADAPSQTAPSTDVAVAPASPKPEAEVERNPFGLTCGPVLTAVSKPAAMVALTLTAPCRGDETVTVRHGALVFSGRTDTYGSLTTTVPALEQQAVYEISFEDGASADTEITIPDAETVERVVLQWQGRSGLQIHALEFGADYGTSGHVWYGAPSHASAAMRTGGGFLTRLGDTKLDAGHMADVYTFPESTRERDGVVRLNIEAEVTAYNCDRDVGGETLQRGADGEMSSVTLTLAMPDCSAVGEYLVLKNLLRDLKIAAK